MEAHASTTAPRRYRHTQALHDRVDTLRGGLQVKHDTNPSCSLWIGATTSSNDSVQITASHCGEFATPEPNSELYQKLSNSGDKIGEEIDDPESTCTVPADADYFAESEDCRWADAAMYAATNSDRFTRGWIGETDSDAGGVDLIHGGMIIISGEVAYPVVNDTVPWSGRPVAGGPTRP